MARRPRPLSPTGLGFADAGMIAGQLELNFRMWHITQAVANLQRDGDLPLLVDAHGGAAIETRKSTLPGASRNRYFAVRRAEPRRAIY
jgi:hypothetical protein